MTPAETLTAAAEKLKRLASDARAGRWQATRSVMVVARGGTVKVAVCSGSLPEGNALNAAYIAAMNPVVGALLAEALAAEVPKALADAQSVSTDFNGNRFAQTNPNLLALATEILNEGENA